MPRVIGGEGLNELRVHDNISNSDMVLYYRTPTTQERAGYENESLQRKGRKLKFKRAAARLKYGLKILKGFREGDFAKDVGGKMVPIASDPESEHYDPQWKELIVKGGADLIMTLAGHVFDLPVEIEEDEEIEDGDPDDEDSAKN